MLNTEQTDLLILALKKLDAIDTRLSALEKKFPKTTGRPAKPGESYASAIKAFWEKKNV